MKILVHWVMVAAGVVALAACSRTEKPEAASAAWVDLFNGENFDGWVFDVKDGSPPETIWSVRDGVIVVNGKNKSIGMMRTAEDYSNYELEVEWRWPDEPGNSGVLIHCSQPRFLNVWPKSMEVQLQNGNAGDLITIGETIEVPPEQIAKIEPGAPWKERLRHNLTDDSEKPPGEWNHMHIKAENGSITVHVNGDLVNHGWNCSVNSGAICLQAEGANVEFRNVRIRPL